MIAGPNGSGKSTLITALRADPRFDLPKLYINADDLQRERGIRNARKAQQLASELRAEAIANRQDVMYETVMSHPSKIAELQVAKNAGYHITVLLVATGNPDVNVRRVGVRVAAGGHDVPEDRIRARYIRTLALAPAAIALADQAYIFDNSFSGETGLGLSQEAALIDGRLCETGRVTAVWVVRLIEQVNQNAAAAITVSPTP
jgi:predicted ABC-type ATPase